MRFLFFFFLIVFSPFAKEKCENSYFFISSAFYYQNLNTEKEKNEEHKKEALKNFQKHLECNPQEKNPTVYLQKAKSEIEINRLDEAEKTLDKLQNINSYIREVYLLKTKIYYETNRVSEASSLLASNIYKFPEDMEMIYFLAYSYYISAKFDLAKLYLIYLDEIIKSNPRKGYSYKASTINLLIKICLKTGDFQNALVYLKTYLEKNIYDFSKRLSFVKILAYTGEYETAIKELYGLREKFKKSSHIDELLVELLYQTKNQDLEDFIKNPDKIYPSSFFKVLVNIKEKKFEKAEKKLQELIEENPQKIVYLEALYEVYKFQSEKEKGKKVLTKAIKLAFRLKNYTKEESFLLEILNLKLSQEEKLATFYKLSEHYDIKENYQKSIEYLIKALEIAKNQDTEKIKLKLAYTYQLNQEYKKSEETLQKMLEQSPQNPHIFYLLSLVQINEKDYQEAINYLNQAINLDRENALYYFYRASIFEEINQKDKLEKDLLKSIELAPENFMSYNYLGYFYAENSIKLDRSIELLQKAIQNEPLDENYQDSLGWAYFKKNDLEKSFFHLNLATKLLNQKKLDNSTIYQHIADIFNKKNQFSEAKIYYQKAKKYAKEPKTSKEIQEKLDKIP